MITNKTGIHPGIAAWLANSNYNNGSNEYITTKPIISATSLIRPIRQLILTSRIESGQEQSNLVPDVTDFIAAKMGTAIHDSIDEVWRNDWKTSLKELDFPQRQIDNMLVNPEAAPADLPTDAIPVYVEKRSFKELHDVVISGKFDMVYNGDLIDFKTTSTFVYVNDSKKEDYILQGSIYKWLNPDIVKSNHVYITYFFTDWQKYMTFSNPKYPKQKIMTVAYELMSVDETDAWINSRLADYRINFPKTQSDMVECSDKDLWMGPTVFKYYADPNKALDPNAKCTKKFSSQAEAITHFQMKGLGKIVEVKGKVKACAYCQAQSICDQYKTLVNNGQV